MWCYILDIIFLHTSEPLEIHRQQGLHLPESPSYQSRRVPAGSGAHFFVLRSTLDRPLRVSTRVLQSVLQLLPPVPHYSASSPVRNSSFCVCQRICFSLQGLSCFQPLSQLDSLGDWMQHWTLNLVTTSVPAPSNQTLAASLCQG